MRYNAQTIIENLGTSVLVTDNLLRITYANSAAEQLFGMSRSRLQNKRFDCLIDKNEHRLLENLALAVKPNFQGFSAADVLISPEPGRTIKVDISIDAYLGDRGHGLIIEAKSIVHQQKLIDEIQLRDQHNAARDLVRNLAHEIKNPLGGIRGAAQLLEMTYGSTVELKEYTSLIIEQTDRLKALVDRLLGPQKPSPMIPTNIHFVIEKVLSLIAMQTQGKVSIKKDYDPSLPELNLDSDAMEQVFINLILNAVQALSSAKTESPLITIKTRAAFGQVINNKKYQTSIVISVINNGPEIPENIRQTIFYPMVSTKATGNGLGLSIAQSIVEHHNGSIECISDSDLTVFKVILPLKKGKI